VIMRILVVDDDQEVCSLLAEFFDQEGVPVDFAHDGRQGLEYFRRGQFDLLVLDVVLPVMDGFEVLRQLRRNSQVPVLMLTARGDDIDRILGLEMGADDYLVKPFNPRELLARIRSILRRTHPGLADPGNPIQIGDVVLDPSSRLVTCDGRDVELTSYEFDLLEMLMRSAGRVLRRERLIKAICDRHPTPFDRSIDIHVSHRHQEKADA